MRIFEDEKNGIFGIALDDSNDNILRFARMKYVGSRKQFEPDAAEMTLQDYVAYPTKVEAVAAAKRLRFTAAHVERIGSRFWRAWGIRHDMRDSYFLACYT